MYQRRIILAHHQITAGGLHVMFLVLKMICPKQLMRNLYLLLSLLICPSNDPSNSDVRQIRIAKYKKYQKKLGHPLEQRNNIQILLIYPYNSMFKLSLQSLDYQILRGVQEQDNTI